MKKFNRGGGFGKKNFTRPGGGPRKFSGGGFRRPGPREDGDFGGEKKLYPATCSVCGGQCQVPFRPDGSRPIYCRDCFRQHGGEGGRGDRTQREDRGTHRQFHRPMRDAGRGGPDQADLVRLLEKIDGKLDRILEVMGGEAEGE